MTTFRRSAVFLIAGLLAAGLLAACQPGVVAGPSRSSGSLALSSDDALLYAVDSDNGIMAVVDAKAGERLATVKVGLQPMRVLVGPDDSIYVANRGSRSVSVIRRGDWKEAARLDVGVEPTGLALAEEGRTLLVTSSAALDSVETGTLTAFDTARLEQRWVLSVGAEPRAVAAISGGRALVALSREGEFVEVDLAQAKVTRSSIGVYAAANASKGKGGGFSSFKPRALGDLVVSKDGNRVFAPAVWAREDAIARRPSVAGGYYSSGGPCNIGAVASAGLLTVDTTGAAHPKVDDLTSCLKRDAAADFPTSALSSRDTSLAALQGPTVAALDSSGDWLFVVNRESQNLAVVPAWRRSGGDLTYDRTGTSIRLTVGIGAGADGIALSADGTRAWVYSQFDHRIDVLTSSGSGASETLVKAAPIVVAEDTLAPDLAAGRRLFYDATDTRLSSKQTTVACSTCHLEGRDDGHVWEFPDGPRQTPTLAGRHLLATAPYHWSGEFESLARFNTHTITERMGGSGLDERNAAKLDAFIDQLPAADNAVRTSLSSDALEQGRAAFEKAGCNTCHAGALLTNNLNANVGTLIAGGSHPDNGPVVGSGFNVPSLLGLGRSAPYLHDGSEASLEDRVLHNPQDRHGSTSRLSADERAQLLVFLKAL